MISDDSKNIQMISRNNNVVYTNDKELQDVVVITDIDGNNQVVRDKKLEVNYFYEFLKRSKETNRKNLNFQEYLDNKYETIRQYMSRGTDYYKSELYERASMNFRYAIVFLESDPYPDEFRLTSDEILSLKFAYCVVLLSHDAGHEIQVWELLSELIAKYGYENPFLCLSLAEVLFKLTRYELCINSLQEGLNKIENTRNRQLNWPCSETLLVETNSESLKEKMESLLQEAKKGRVPDERCYYPLCRFAGNIYKDVLNFDGYVTIKCTESCQFNYHSSCWKAMKKVIIKKHGSSDVLKMGCSTPDCSGIYCEMIVYNESSEVKSCRKIKIKSHQKQKHRGNQFPVSNESNSLESIKMMSKNMIDVSMGKPNFDQRITPKFDAIDQACAMKPEDKPKESHNKKREETVDSFILNEIAKIMPSEFAHKKNISFETVKDISAPSTSGVNKNVKNKEVADKRPQLPINKSVLSLIPLNVGRPIILQMKNKSTQTEVDNKSVGSQYSIIKTNNIGIQVKKELDPVKRIEMKTTSVNTDEIVIEPPSKIKLETCEKCLDLLEQKTQLQIQNEKLLSQLEALRNTMSTDHMHSLSLQNKYKDIIIAFKNELAAQEVLHKSKYSSSVSQETYEMRIKYLQNLLLQQVNNCQNVYTAFYTLYKDKCKRTLWELNDVVQFLNHDTVPTKLEVDVNINHWNYAISQITNCQGLVMHYFDELINNLATLDFEKEIKLHPLPDLPSEPPNIVNTSFKLLLAVNFRLIKETNYQKSVNHSYQTQSYPQHQINSLFGQPLIPFGYTPQSSNANNPYPNVLRSQVAISNNIIPNVHTSAAQDEPKDIHNNQSTITKIEPKENGCQIPVKNDKPEVTTNIPKQQKKQKNSPESILKTIMPVLNVKLEKDLGADKENACAKVPEKTNIDSIGTNDIGFEPELSVSNSESDTSSQVSLSLLVAMKKHFPSISNAKLIEALTILKIRHSKLSGTPMKAIVKIVKEILASLDEQSSKPQSSKLDLTKTSQPVWAKIDNEVKQWHKEIPDLNCSICFEHLNWKTTVELICLHSFHKQCIKQWLQNNSICPICRTYITLDDEYPPLVHK